MAARSVRGSHLERVLRCRSRIAPPALPLSRIATRMCDGNHRDNVGFDHIVDSERESPDQCSPNAESDDLIPGRTTDDAVVCRTDFASKRQAKALALLLVPGNGGFEVTLRRKLDDDPIARQRYRSINSSS